MRIAAMAAGMGGNVRVGLEDSLWIKPKQLATSNAEQVTQVKEINRRHGARNCHSCRGQRHA